jgi:hypothetical protein
MEPRMLTDFTGYINWREMLYDAQMLFKLSKHLYFVYELGEGCDW